MKKILATVAGLAAFSLLGTACSAVDKEATSTTPIAAAQVQPSVVDDMRKEVQDFKKSRAVVRPDATPMVSHHENHVNLIKRIAAANAKARAEAQAKVRAKAAALAKAKKLAEAKAAKKKAERVKTAVKPKIHKTVKVKKAVKKTYKKTYTKAKKVSLAGIAACIAKYESGGNPRAQNPHSSASGLFQFVDGTWNHFGGYSRAMYAPVSVQLKKFYIVWDGGRGAHHWVVAPKCGY